MKQEINPFNVFVKTELNVVKIDSPQFWLHTATYRLRNGNEKRIIRRTYTRRPGSEVSQSLVFLRA
jgi:RIO-like serine/threonine protein kinase